MSLIACTDSCIYQQDGYCSLSRAMFGSSPNSQSRCVYFVSRASRASQDYTECLSDIADTDQSKALRDG